jgi:predicted aspartyl protease
MTRILLKTFLILAVLTSAQSQKAQTSDRLHDLYEANQLFALRDAVGQSNGTRFYKAAVAASSNSLELAKRSLNAIIKTAPHSQEADDARDLLINMYMRNGMYREAHQQILATLRDHPNAEDANGILPLATSLGELPAMTLAASKASKLQIEVGSIFLPLQINGRKAEYFFDTGSAFSVLTQSEADRLGLKPKAVDGKIGESSGRGLTGIQVAAAADLVIGGLHLQNVPFLVVSDQGEPWNHLAQEGRGIIGLPVLLAMKTLRWTPTGQFEFGFPAHDLNLAASNMLFHNSNPVADVVVDGKHLCFTLDTGATDTDLNPPFAQALPALLKTGKPESRSIEGLGGSTTGNSILLPSVTFEVGGKSISLQPAHVFVEHGLGNWAAGNLGMDILRQSHSFTLDFQAMALHLD